MKIGIKMAIGAALLGAAVSTASAQTLDPFPNADAMNRVGIQYAQSKDYVMALEWYERAAANGSVAALGNIATLYFYGFGVPQSYEQAAKVLEVAVQAGDPDAQNKLAALYDDGLGVAQDHAKAFELFQRAAAQGYSPAMANLGRAYIEGRGVERDDVRGYALMRAALDVGVPQSMRAMAQQEIDAASARLDERQLADAKGLSSRLLAAATKDGRALQPPCD
jgi:TPR repeat protein